MIIPEYEDLLMTLVYLAPDDQKEKAMMLKNSLSRYIKSLKKTLRDEFAMRAVPNPLHQTPNDCQYIAKCCYQLADAMLAEREKEFNRE